MTNTVKIKDDNVFGYLIFIVIVFLLGGGFDLANKYLDKQKNPSITLYVNGEEVKPRNGRIVIVTVGGDIVTTVDGNQVLVFGKAAAHDDDPQKK